MLVQMCASFSYQSIKSLLLFLPPLVFSFLAPKPSYGHIFVLRSILKNFSNKARSNEFRRQEADLRLSTLVAETSTHLHQHIEKLAQSDPKQDLVFSVKLHLVLIP